MSHFTVGVIVKHKEELESRLAPYCEQDPDYYEKFFAMSKEQYISEYREQNPDTKLTDDEIWTTQATEDYSKDEIDLEEGVIYGFYNPDAKWDWYEIGGRWANELIVKTGCPCVRGFHYGDVNENKDGRADGAKIKDILWYAMNETDIDELKRLNDFWDGYVMGNAPDENYGFVMYKPEYYKERYKDKMDYIEKMSSFRTHSLLVCPEDEDEEWIEAGEMGWFGMDASTEDSESEYEQRFEEIIRDPKYQDYWFIMIDCHI